MFIIFILFMKQFNTFAANSIALSDYYSPKNSSKGPQLPSNKYQKDQKSKTHLTDNYFKSPTFHESSTYLQNPTSQPQHLISLKPTLQNVSESSQTSQENTLDHNISMILSTVSMPHYPKPQLTQQKLFNLENSITQHILELREEKIILMQELSKIIDGRNLFQYYLLRYELGKEDQVETNNGSPQRNDFSLDRQEQERQEFVDISVSAPLLKENQELRLKLKQLQIKQEIFGSGNGANTNRNSSRVQDTQKNQQILNEIVHVREMINSLQNELKLKQLKPNPSNGQVSKKQSRQQSRFITFLPQDRQKHLQMNNQNNQPNKGIINNNEKQRQKDQYRQLQARYNKLKIMTETHTNKLSIEQQRKLEDLRRENKRLIQEVQNMIRVKEGNRGNSGNTNNRRYENEKRINQLRNVIEENQREKELFLEELERFKETMIAAKAENRRLKAQLHV